MTTNHTVLTPSDDDLMDVWMKSPQGPQMRDQLLGFARVLLFRYAAPQASASGHSVDAIPKPRRIERHSDQSVLVVFGSCREASVCERAMKSTPAEGGERRCEYCDGTGDVHDATGEWRGSCNCMDSAKGAGDVDERADFEAWMKKENPRLDLEIRDGEYIFTPARARWSGWQARAALDLRGTQ